MQFIQDRRPIERLSAEPSVSSFRDRILLLSCQPHTSPGTKARWDSSALLAAGQLFFHFTDGLAEGKRRDSDMRKVLGYADVRTGLCWLSLSIMCDSVYLIHPEMTNESG